MPREGDPRVSIRLSPEEMASIGAVAESVNVSVGALIRECAVRYAPTVAREVSRGDLRLRRQSVGPIPTVVRARELVPPSVDAMSRQQRLNADAARARAGRKGVGS